MFKVASRETWNNLLADLECTSDEETCARGEGDETEEGGATFCVHHPTWASKNFNDSKAILDHVYTLFTPSPRLSEPRKDKSHPKTTISGAVANVPVYILNDKEYRFAIDPKFRM